MPRKEDYWKDPEKFRKQTRGYVLAHPEWKRQSDREWERKDRTANPEKWRAKGRRERAGLTPEQRATKAEYQKKWFAENPTYSREHQAKDHVKAPAKRMIEAARVRAKRLDVPFDLDWRTIEIPATCPVLGTELIAGNGAIRGSSPALDRLIPALGYVATNVRVISQSANAIKKDKSIDELRDYAARLQSQLDGARAVIAYLERELG